MYYVLECDLYSTGAVLVCLYCINQFPSISTVTLCLLFPVVFVETIL